MAGLQRILKMHGRMQVNNVMWVWDYAKDEARLESEMTKEEIKASEIAKWSAIKNEIDERKSK